MSGELELLRQRESQLQGELFAVRREAAVAREESSRLQDALNHAQASDSGAVSAEIERCQAELSKVRIELDKALGEGFSLRETISELRAQIDTLEKGRQTDAANLRMYINENDTLRKRWASSVLDLCLCAVDKARAAFGVAVSWVPMTALQARMLLFLSTSCRCVEGHSHVLLGCVPTSELSRTDSRSAS